ncbi:helix-turn-helix domain-containing protein [Thermodesulfovibrio sp. 1176]|uniref:helix-turn-helix domain-containing protein n=1 Tax=Thermodesulfovibrio sp. 1176 TaxID=3043424 RepID=UPI002482F0B1|nr:helix-turn-helix domain-containing protein [Thermodesulfovibrio sp. 1176]MDI1473026.1 helix-turn-helix domain-containing protein [Thermodesulfovibrio sp. 1176]
MDRKKQEKLEKLLLTKEEAMEFLGLKSRTMLNFYIEKRGLPYLKIGKFLRFPLKDIKRWKERTIEKAVA